MDYKLGCCSWRLVDGSCWPCNDTYQWFLGSCVKLSQTAVVVVKDSVRS